MHGCSVAPVLVSILVVSGKIVEQRLDQEFELGMDMPLLAYHQ